MKKLNLAVLLLASIFIFACSGSTENVENTENDSTLIEENIENEAEATSVESVETQSTEPITVVMSKMKKGDEILGLTVSELEYKSEKTFTFTLKGDITLEGTIEISEVDDEITFSPNESQKNANLIDGDMEKPFIMWTSFRNEKEFLAAMSAEQKRKLKKREAVPAKLVMKNYQVHSSAEQFYIGAKADFVKFEK